MNYGEYKQHILTSKQKYLFCVQIKKEPVSSHIRVYPLHSITESLKFGWWTSAKNDVPPITDNFKFEIWPGHGKITDIPPPTITKNFKLQI